MTERGSPRITVVVCTRERVGSLDLCLRSLSRLDYPSFDVMVVDNAPRNDEAEQVGRRWNARYLVEPVAGLSRARNRGARACDSEIVAFIDDDAEAEHRWLAELAPKFADPSVMAAAGRVEALDREASSSCADWSGLPIGGDAEKTFDKSTPSWFELANFGGIGIGVNMAFRRSAFDLWPGFDERLGRGAKIDGAEEHHAFFSLIDRGFRVAYAPRAVVYHDYPRTREAWRERRLKDVRGATGYFSFLFFEQPRYRAEVVRYALSAMTGRRRRWRPLRRGPRPPALGRWNFLVACLQGALG